MIELIKTNLKEKAFLIGLTINTIFASISFISYATTQGSTPYSQMFSPEQFNTLLSSKITLIYYIFLPILICIPGSMILYKDKKSGMDINYINRMGRKKYYFGRYISIFLTTSLAMSLPFIVEYLMATLIFHPNEYSGFLDYQNFFSLNSLQNFTSIGFHELYYFNRTIYFLIVILLHGVVSGILAVFTASFINLNFKYAVVYFLPAYVYVFAIQRLISYDFFLRMFNIYTFTPQPLVNLVFAFIPLVIITLLNYLVSINPRRVLVYEEN